MAKIIKIGYMDLPMNFESGKGEYSPLEMISKLDFKIVDPGIRVFIGYEEQKKRAFISPDPFLLRFSSDDFSLIKAMKRIRELGHKNGEFYDLLRFALDNPDVQKSINIVSIEESFVFRNNIYYPLLSSLMNGDRVLGLVTAKDIESRPNSYYFITKKPI